MLTYPSDSLPQIVCPMDEDALPPNPFCSAPPHSEPEPPLLPLPSTTPSCDDDDGKSDNTRSGRIQGVRDQTPKEQSHKDSGAAQRPSRRNPSPTKRERESGMVQVSQSLSVKLPSVNTRHLQQAKQNKDISSEHPTQHNDQKNPRKKANISATENVDKQFAGSTTQDLDTPQSNPPKSDMDVCGELAVGHAVENPSAVKGWVIGPLFQSFKSKVASFTEIVMSPVKRFKPNSAPLSNDHSDELAEYKLHTISASSSGTSDPGQMFHIQGQSENGNEDSKADQPASLSPIKVSDIGGGKNLKLFDVDLSGRSSAEVVECALTEMETNANDSVPLQHSLLACNASEQVSECNKSVVRSSSLLFQSPDDASASHESKLKMSSEMEEQKSKPATQLKPLPRKHTGSRPVLQKGSSKNCPSECDPGTNGELFSHIQTHSDSSDTGTTQSIPSIVYYTPPETLCLPDDDGRKIDGGISVQKSPRNTFKGCGVNGSAPKTTLETQKQQVEWELKPDSVRVGKAKRRLKLTETSRSNIEPDLSKRKRLTAGKHTEDRNGDVLNVYSDSGVLKGFKPPMNEVVSTNILTDMEIMLDPAGTRVPVPTGMKRKAKGGHQRFAALNKAVLQTETENPSGTMVVCSLDHSNGVSEINQKDRSRKRNTGGSGKGLKKRTSISKPDVNVDNIETTITTTLAEETQEELSNVFFQPLDAKLSKAQPKYVPKKKDVSPVFSVDQSQSPSKLMNLNKKHLKRKTQNQSSIPEVGSTLVSTSSAASARTLVVLVHREESWKTGPMQPSKRPKKDCRGSAKSSVSGGAQVTENSMDDCHEAVKESQSKEDQDKMSVESVCSEMAPDENNQKPVSPLCQPCFVQLTKQNVKRLMGTRRNHSKKRTAAPLADEIFPSDAETTNHSKNTTIDEIKEDLDKVESCTYTVSINAPGLRQSSRRAKNMPRRKCRVLRSKTPRDEEEEMNSLTREEVDLARPCSSENGFSGRLLRSYSCPEIPSLLRPDTSWCSSLHSPQYSRIHASPQHQSLHIPPVPHAHKSPRRARRHTVSSVEVEREIAPLCLRKEVYPSRRSASYGSIVQHLPPNVQHSPSTSLALCFLSSPLAFLSKRFENRGAATSSHVSSPTSASNVLTCATSPSRSTVWHHPGFLPRIDTSAATLSATCSVLSQIPLECEIETRQQSEEEEDGEDTSCSSREFEDVGLREEKALSDSEIKVVKKHEERGKVSSIRIRKTLPKPQNNLTPMGLPKPIRLKKKEFSLEEIYTNKNFTKPPESRLETIFEMPLSRRNGSQLLFGQKRLKRWVEFPEVGVARKPKKPLVGAGKPGTSTPLGRPRRGGYHNPKDEPSISVQELDSLLCAKLDQLHLWLTFDQKDS